MTQLNKGALKFLYSFVVIATCCAFGGCGSGQSESVDPAGTTRSSTKSTSVEPKTVSNTAPKEPAARNRAVVRKASLAIRTPDVEKSEREVTEFVGGLGGFVVESNSSNLDTTSPTIRLKVRVPVGEFDRAILSFEKLGHRLSKSISGEDVTAQLVDYKARLKVMLAQESSFRQMLSRNGSEATSTQLSEKIMNLRADIESMQAQRSVLADLAALSTIDLDLVGEAKSLYATADANWARESWNASTSALGAMMRAFGSVAIFAAVFLPIWGPFAYGFVRLVKKSSGGSRDQPSGPEFEP